LKKYIDEIKVLLEEVKSLTPIFNKAKGEDQFSSLQRLPFSVNPCQEGCLIQGSRNGSITYSSNVRTYLCIPVVAAVLCVRELAKAYPNRNAYITNDELFNNIALSNDVDCYYLNISDFLFTNIDPVDEKTSSHHPYSCDEINTMVNTDYHKIMDFIKCTNIFHGFSLLIDFERQFFKDIANYKLTACEILAVLESVQNIIKGMKLYIETVNELESYCID
jgi:hypothetical protein